MKYIIFLSLFYSGLVTASPKEVVECGFINDLFIMVNKEKQQRVFNMRKITDILITKDRIKIMINHTQFVFPKQKDLLCIFRG